MSHLRENEIQSSVVNAALEKVAVTDRHSFECPLLLFLHKWNV